MPCRLDFGGMGNMMAGFFGMGEAAVGECAWVAYNRSRTLKR